MLGCFLRDILIDETQMILTVTGLKQGGLAGIDLSFFNCTDNFRGIKNIPDGPHIFHYGESIESLRHVMLFKSSTHIVFEEGKFRYGSPDDPDPRLMLDYPTTPEWNILASNIDFEPAFIDTLTALESFELPKNTWPDGVVGSERTEYYLDKTWYVSQQNVTKLIGQYQLAFLLFITCRNPQAEMNWHKQMELLFSCRKGLERSDWSLYLLKILRTQLKIMPEDYRDEEVSFLEHALKNLYINVNGLGSAPLGIEPSVEVQAQHILNTLQNWGADWSAHEDLEPQENDLFTAKP